MCPISGSNWNNAANAGVWTLNLATARGASGDSLGGRSALYL